MPPNARQLIESAQISRPEDTLLVEENERHIIPGSVQGTPISASAEGVLIKTISGGEITVFNGAQNFTPNTGESYQLRFSPGKASLVANSQAEQPEPETLLPGPVVATRAPTTGDSTTVPFQLWFDLSPGVVNDERTAELWAVVPQYGEHVKITGGSITTIHEDRPPDLDSSDPVNNPPPHAPGDGDLWHYTSLGRYWQYRADTNTYENVSGNLVFRQVNPIVNGVLARALEDGDMLFVKDAVTGVTCSWLWDAGAEDWTNASCCGDCPDDPPNVACTPGTEPQFIDDETGWSCTPPRL